MVEKYTLFPRTFLDVISLTLFDVISMVQKSTLFPFNFFDVILMVEKSTLFPHTFFDEISMGKNLASFLVKLQTNENIRGKHSTFARSFSLNFSSISPWSSPVSLKFESYNIQHYKKNCSKLVFWVFTEQLLYHIIFKQLHWYEVTLVKKCNKPLLQKSKINNRPKKIYKKLVQSQRKK